MMTETEAKKQIEQLLSSDEWLRKKVDPGRRMREHKQYFSRHFPELGPGMNHASLLDIGCGPGESLILAEQNGHFATGIEASDGAGGMGDSYVRYARLNHILHDLSVIYGKATDVVHYMEPGFDCINMRGSFEQIFSMCMLGEPHDKHHKASLMTWDIDAARISVGLFMSRLGELLKDRGRIVIHCNGSINHQAIKAIVRNAGIGSGISGYWIEDKIYHGRKE